MKVEIQEPIYRVTVDLPKEIDSQYVRESLAAILYYNGKLSEKEARTISGTTRRQFEEEIIPKFGLSMIGGTKEDIEIEKEACQRSS